MAAAASSAGSVSGVQIAVGSEWRDAAVQRNRKPSLVRCHVVVLLGLMAMLRSVHADWSPPTMTPTEVRLDYVCVCCVDDRAFSSTYGCLSKQDACTYCCSFIPGDPITPQECSEQARDEVDAKGVSLHLLCEPQPDSSGEHLFYTRFPYPPNKEEPYESTDPLVVNPDFDEIKKSKEDGGPAWVPGMCASGAWSVTRSTGLRWSTTAVLVCAISQLLVRQLL